MKVVLDQFYTKDEIAELCWNHLLDVISEIGKNIDEMFFLEPSAGKGSFYKLMPVNMRLGLDIDPKYGDIKSQDFLSTMVIDTIPENTVSVGNPPFGKRSNLAIAFFNHSAYFAETIAFIVPIVFRKYMIHKKLDNRMKFVSKLDIPKDSFYIHNGKTYSVNTEFQIWTSLSCKYRDMRESVAPPICHKDFIIWQYNNTPESLKVFKNDFDFAIPCQGWQDYTIKEKNAENCEKHKQWMLIKADNEDVMQKLMLIDYNALAYKNTTSTPGFRKADLVKEYSDLYD